MKRWVARHPLVAFYALAYACSWSIAVPLALQARGVLPTHLPFALHYMMAFGPAFAASVVRGIVGDPVRSTGPVGQRAWWCAIGALSPLALFAIAQGAALSLHLPRPAWTSLGRLNFLPDL